MPNFHDVLMIHLLIIVVPFPYRSEPIVHVMTHRYGEHILFLTVFLLCVSAMLTYPTIESSVDELSLDNTNEEPSEVYLFTGIHVGVYTHLVHTK